VGSGGLRLRVVTDGPIGGGSSGDSSLSAAGKSWSSNEGNPGNLVISGDGALDGRTPVVSLDSMGGMVLGTTGDIGIGQISSDVSESVSIGDGGSADNSGTMSSNQNVCGGATGGTAGATGGTVGGMMGGTTGGATGATGGITGGATGGAAGGAAGGMIGGGTMGMVLGAGGMGGMVDGGKPPPPLGGLACLFIRFPIV